MAFHETTILYGILSNSLRALLMLLYFADMSTRAFPTIISDKSPPSIFLWCISIPYSKAPILVVEFGFTLPIAFPWKSLPPFQPIHFVHNLWSLLLTGTWKRLGKWRVATMVGETILKDNEVAIHGQLWQGISLRMRSFVIWNHSERTSTLQAFATTHNIHKCLGSIPT